MAAAFNNDPAPNDRLEEPERLPDGIDDDTLRKYFMLMTGPGAGGPVPWAHQQIGIRRPALYSPVARPFSARYARRGFPSY